MFHVTCFAAPLTQPVSVDALRDFLRLNDKSEDAQLSEFLAAAVDLFESESGRAVLSARYRQDLSAWPGGPIVLGKGGVTAITSVNVYQADGSALPLAAVQWSADLMTPPARVFVASVPAPIAGPTGIPVSPVGNVEFTAGWDTPASVPNAVRVAIKQLAAHWYETREAFTASASEMKTTPKGWARVVDRYRTGVSGPWGQ